MRAAAATHSEPPGKSALDEAATVFVGVRRRLFGIAYRMLGSAAEAEDVVSYSDGGGVRGASRIPVLGGARGAKYLAAFAPRFWPGAGTEWVEANGRPAVLVSHEGRAVALPAVDASARGIERIMWVMNPAKLDPYVQSLSGPRGTA